VLRYFEDLSDAAIADQLGCAETTVRGYIWRGLRTLRVDIDENDVRSYGPEPEGIRPWLGRLAHGSGEAWVRLRDGTEARFAIGGGPHVTLIG